MKQSLFLRIVDTAGLFIAWIVRWRSIPVIPWLNAARCYQRGDFEAAAALYIKGLDRNPRSRARVNALLDLSHCLFRLRRFEEAEQYLRQALSLSPNEREAYVRLARLQLWLGYACEALWTMRVCLQRVSPDPELVTLYISAVVDSGGAAASTVEAQELLEKLHYDVGGFPRLEVARARLELLIGDKTRAREDLARLAKMDGGPFEAVVAFAEVLMQERAHIYARHQLHRALAVAPGHPRVLRLLASLYLREGGLCEPQHAVQLAVRACQATNWCGAREALVLTQAYLAAGEKAGALLAATKARDIVAGLLGSFPEVERLEQLVRFDMGEYPPQ